MKISQIVKYQNKRLLRVEMKRGTQRVYVIILVRHYNPGLSYQILCSFFEKGKKASITAGEEDGIIFKLLYDYA